MDSLSFLDTFQALWVVIEVSLNEMNVTVVR